ncbi:DUF6286 domain-containing protein [Streptomyces minutiscleroticus]|uniref:DUF6286 domain-containing protein n=1 Tax=Streptomyces minutiscleroticus TaxID=68238 RepID=A0A918U0B9_9ACTN|nr:DUF6286 domain-containing protein [Streptomyces minutiscleroticus]GGX78792.1 hypothetical protein GCM10010358_36340 [Streptomyces minutiscleroticus]
MSESQGFQGPEDAGSTRQMSAAERPAGGELGQSVSAAAYEPRPVPDVPPRGGGRFWSVRRVPAGVLALLLAAGAGLLLYDVVAVRAGRTAGGWRRAAADALAERPLDDVWVLAGAALAAALGLWLLLLAATPGLRRLLPMRRTHPEVRAGLYRGAAGLALRDRAMEVPGVRSVRVRMRRRRADVRAVSHFRELDDVRADLDAALADGVRGLGLARPPRLSVRVARPGRKG